MKNEIALEILHSTLEEDALQHHGILGMKWGKRNGPPYPLSEDISSGKRLKIQKDDYGLKNLKTARTANLDKWGKTADKNVLYVVGYSGSGKSTTSLRLAKSGDTIVHLDGYSEMHAEDAQNKAFNTYLDKHVPKWKQMAYATKEGSDKVMKRHSKEYWDTVDTFRDAIEEYSKEQYLKGNRVIVEGVQIADDWLAADKKYYANKPMVILNTGAIKSMKRAFTRDDRGGIIKGLKSLDSAKEYIQWYRNSSKRLNELSDISGARKNQKYLNEFMDTYVSQIR